MIIEEDSNEEISSNALLSNDELFRKHANDEIAKYDKILGIYIGENHLSWW